MRTVCRHPASVCDTPAGSRHTVRIILLQRGDTQCYCMPTPASVCVCVITCCERGLSAYCMPTPASVCVVTCCERGLSAYCMPTPASVCVITCCERGLSAYCMPTPASVCVYLLREGIECVLYADPS